MKKILLISIIGFAVFAFAITASAAENWRLSGNYTITFTCTLGCGGSYVHTMNVSLYDNNDGTFSGIGYYNTNPSITWTVTGDVTGDTIEYLVDYDSSTYAVDADGTIAMDGTMSGTAIGPGQAFNWVMSPKATFYRYAEITSPAVDSIVTDTLNLGAFLMDNDYDPVQWAVRKGTCAAATNTVMGNVDGFSTPFSWAIDAGNKYKYIFSASANVTAWSEGIYCFIFNPSEDAGESDIRMTEFFKVNWDEDNDGYFANNDCNDNDATIYPGAPELCDGKDNDCNEDTPMDYVDADGDKINDCGADKCLGTEYDSHWFTYNTFGVNRWAFTANGWITNEPKGKGPKASFTIADTYGCSCTQILDAIKAATGEELGGHYKFGCSKSILEAWIAGEYYIGPTLIETVEVPANDADGVESSAVLEAGKDYFLKASGTGMACNQPGCVITFDAEYSTSDGINWVDGVAAPYNGYGLDLLDLKVDGNFVDWGAYNTEHVYQINYAGTGNLLGLAVYDLAGSYFNDTGSLLVDIIEDKWVDLW